MAALILFGFVALFDLKTPLHSKTVLYHKNSVLIVVGVDQIQFYDALRGEAKATNIFFRNSFR